MNDRYDSDRLAHLLGKALRELRTAGHHVQPDALAYAQETLAELCSRLLGALLVDNPEWSSEYWFDGVAIDEFRPMEPNGVEVMGNVHFARGQDEWFTAPVYFALTAPPDAPLAYRILFDDRRWDTERDRSRNALSGPTQWRFEMVRKR